MKQQFFVGDKVYLADKIYKHSHVFWIDEIEKSKGIIGVVQDIVTYESGDIGYSVKFDNRYYNCDAKWLTLVERAWQKNTGIQPIEDGIEVLVKRTDSTIDRAEACMFDWYAGDIGSIVEWRIADGLSSNVEQPEAIPPSHVALGDELAAVDATPTSVSTEQDFVNSPKHYAFFDGVEAIEIIASSMSVEAFRGYCMGNALKYRLRVGKKDKVEQEIAKADKYGELFEKHKHLCKGGKQNELFK